MLEKVSINILDARYLLAIIVTFISSVKKKRTTLINVLLGITIMWIAYGLKNTLFALSAVLANVFLLFVFRMNQYYFTAFNIAILYIYKIFGGYLDPRIKGTFDISGFLMILTVKAGYIAKDFDKNFKNLFEYLFFVPGLLTGPTMPYNEFIKRDRMVSTPFPSIQLAKAIVFLCLYAILRSFPFKEKLFISDCSFPARVGFVYLFNFCRRNKFYFAWNFSDSCFSLYNCPGYLNIDFYRVELTESIREISLNWNKFISLWIKTLFFTPLKEKSIPMAVAVSYSVSAALHGINPCYFIFFLSFALYSKPISYANEILKYTILKRIQMMLFIAYFSLPFNLLGLKELYISWKNLFFYGHVYCTFWLIMYQIKLYQGKNKKVKKE
ncbi:Lysophospholipid acyltransferase [Glugoides intestinalis]